MNNFRDAVTHGRMAAGPLMPVKQSKQAPGESGLAVPRAESRSHNQRVEDRQVLAADEARLFINRKSYIVDLMNLSGGGAMIRTNLPVKLWQRVHLELADGDSVECAVRWIKGDRIGLEFAHETQVVGDDDKRGTMLLATIERNFPDAVEKPCDQDQEALAGGEGAQRRADLRHPLIWSGDIHYDFETTRVRLRNISECGAMVDCSKSIPEGAEILLDLGGAGQHFAVVSWSRGDQLGLRFGRPFDIACLAQAKPDVAPQSWSRTEDLHAGQDVDSPWAEAWERLSLPELRETLKGFLKS